jgi:predicted enzyme related to lactoylglutathione lyase
MNPVVHFEIPYAVGIRARLFYKETFGWEIIPLGPDMGDYMLVNTAKADVKAGAPAGAIGGGLFPKDIDNTNLYPSVVIGVADLPASMEKIKANGGTIVGTPHEIPGFGLYVAFRDTEGNRNSILQPIG